MNRRHLCAGTALTLLMALAASGASAAAAAAAAPAGPTVTEVIVTGSHIEGTPKTAAFRSTWSPRTC